MDRSKLRSAAATGLLLVLVGAGAARATDGQPALIGASNQATSTTEFADTTEGDTALAGSSDAGTAVEGKDVNGTGVVGITSVGIGVHAISGPDTGSALVADGAVAVNGATTLSGPTTLDGITAMERSGIVTVKAGKASRTVPNVQMLKTSMVIAVAQQLRQGVFVVAAVPSATGLTIHLNKQAPKDTRVAWIVIG